MRKSKAVLNRIKFGGKQSGIGDEMVEMISDDVVAEMISGDVITLDTEEVFETVYGAFLSDADGNKKAITKIEKDGTKVKVTCSEPVETDFLTVLVQ